MSPDLVRRFRFFHEHGASWVGHAAVQAIALARAEIEGEERGLFVGFEDEHEPWDGEGPAPTYLLTAYVAHEDEPREWLASLGMIGVDSMVDPYLRVVGAELMREALDGPLAKGKPNARCETPAEAHVRGHTPDRVEIRDSSSNWLVLDDGLSGLLGTYRRRWGVR